MARIDHHGAYSFLIYYGIWLIFFGKGSLIPDRYIVFFIVIFGLLPDFDGIYWLIKRRGEGGMGTDFQHHLYFWTHWPISFTPIIGLFVISVILNFFPEYFLMPVIGIYCGHFLFDSISCGDGLMWGKIPWKRGRYARYINLMPARVDGYHGVYWEARYRKTLISKIGNVAVLLSIIIIFIFQINSIIEHFNDGNPPGISGYFLFPIIFFIIALRIGLKKPSAKALEEPPEGRYADYRVNLNYINGLSKKNQKKHLEKYSVLLEKKGIMEKIKLK